MLRNEGERLKKVVVCAPLKEYALGANDLEKHNIGELSDPIIAIEQHNALKSTLKAFGATVIDTPELENHPNSVFTRDSALSTPKGYKIHVLNLDEFAKGMGGPNCLIMPVKRGA